MIADGRVIVATDPMVDLPELAHDWFGLATWALIAVTAVAAAAIWIWRQHQTTQGQIKGVAKNVTAMRDHIVNDHTKPDQNLRTQLDRIEQNQQEFQRTMTREIGGLRKDIGRLADSAVDDRAMHHQDVERLDGDIARLEKRMT